MTSGVRRARQVVEPLDGKMVPWLRGAAGVLALASMATIAGAFDVRSFPNETEFARQVLTEEKAKRQPHRCNDRVEDFCKVLFNEDAHTLRDIRPALSNLFACYRSDPGREPASQYLMLSCADHHYVEPNARST